MLLSSVAIFSLEDDTHEKQVGSQTSGLCCKDAFTVRAGTGWSGRVQAGWRIHGEARMTAEQRGTRRFCVKQARSREPATPLALTACQGKQRRGGGETKTTNN
ncbi:unnamed protein product [Pleuronectes platessa]|uniref:Uncharacterized protein n=1 Tax=Pleuronectes platessa TaxID=8262 RepID=A0A9N7YL33_PLEPL|nr:unnamed protein product [Pleuronectes platessa]